MDVNDQFFISNNDYEPCNHVIMTTFFLWNDKFGYPFLINGYYRNNLINIYSQTFTKNKYVMSSRSCQLLWTLDMKNDWQM